MEEDSVLSPELVRLERQLEAELDMKQKELAEQEHDFLHKSAMEGRSISEDSSIEDDVDVTTERTMNNMQKHFEEEEHKMLDFVEKRQQQRNVLSSPSQVIEDAVETNDRSTASEQKQVNELPIPPVNNSPKTATPTKPRVDSAAVKCDSEDLSGSRPKDERFKLELGVKTNDKWQVGESQANSPNTRLGDVSQVSSDSSGDNNTLDGRMNKGRSKLISSTTGTLTRSIKSAASIFTKICIILKKCIGAVASCCCAKLLAFVSEVMRRFNGAAYSTQKYFMESLNNHQFMVSKAPNAARITASWVATTKRSVFMSYLYLLTSMLTCMYPTTNNGNVFIALIFLLWATSCKPVSFGLRCVDYFKKYCILDMSPYKFTCFFN